MNKLTSEQILEIATRHQRQMCSVHPHAIIGTIEDAINDALEQVGEGEVTQTESKCDCVIPDYATPVGDWCKRCDSKII